MMQKKKQIIITVSIVVVIAIVFLIAVYRPTVTIQYKGVTSPAIFLALGNDNPIQAVAKVLKKNPDAVNAVDHGMPLSYFKTPLRISVGNFNKPLTVYLLDKGAKPQEALNYFKVEKETKEFDFLENILKERKKTEVTSYNISYKKLVCKLIDNKIVEKKIILTNADILKAQPYIYDNKNYMVRLVLTRKGQEIIGDITSNNIGKKFGFWINGKLIASPEIKGPLYAGVIFIPIKVDYKEAKELAEGIMKINS
ncbi:MAG TPA: hypothetical protein QF753_09365 [Victivallales bacterium]|nr:hypothetical protein [Victivallales bacterium]